jgi:hypothetical protein
MVGLTTAAGSLTNAVFSSLLVQTGPKVLGATVADGYICCGGT